MATGKWLAKLGSKMGQEVTYVGQGFDYTPPVFGVDVPTEGRDAPSAAMLYHTATWKGSAEGIQALEIAKKILQTFDATLFGVPPRPAGLPAWISYLQSPSSTALRNLYNSVAVFVSPSWVEGCALPPGEAAQCGAALCLTDIGGHADYAEHGVTALLSPPHDPSALADNIVRLLRDAPLRNALAHASHDRIEAFRWTEAAAMIEACLLSHHSSP
jgi:glycosyltransferase involved in cell wall biosynthesis